MDDILSNIFGIALLMYMFLFMFLLNRFRSGNIKRKAILRSDLRKTRVLITIASLMLPVTTTGLSWVLTLVLKQRFPTGSEIFPFLMFCPVGLWLSSMFVLWSYTTGWRIIDSEEEE